MAPAPWQAEAVLLTDIQITLLILGAATIFFVFELAPLGAGGTGASG